MKWREVNDSRFEQPKPRLFSPVAALLGGRPDFHCRAARRGGIVILVDDAQLAAGSEYASNMALRCTTFKGLFGRIVSSDEGQAGVTA
jgi:hypothetical protein